MRSVVKIVKTRGNKGEVVCTSPDLFWDNMADGHLLLLQRGTFQRELEVETVRFLGERPVVKFKGIDSINEAYALIGCEILPAHPGAPEAEEDGDDGDEDLVGYTVVDQHGNTVGQVVDIVDRTMQPLLLVQRDDRDCLIPWVEAWLVDWNEDQKRLTLSLPEGLVDLN